MAASKLSSCIAAALAAAVSTPSLSNRAYADSPFRFNPFSSSPSPAAPPPDQSPNAKSESPAEEPRGAGMDPEALERGAKALRQINNSKYSKQVDPFFFIFC